MRKQAQYLEAFQTAWQDLSESFIDDDSIVNHAETTPNYPFKESFSDLNPWVIKWVQDCLMVIGKS